MKKKSTLSALILLLGLGLYSGLNLSYSTGFPSYNSGCSCHGPQNPNTIVSITGLPTFYTPGQAYPFTVTVSHPTNFLAGFQVQTNIGTLSSSDLLVTVQTGNMSAGHNSPAFLIGSASFSLTWTAPAIGGTAATFSAVGNAGNGSGDPSGDAWNTANVTNVALPVNFSDINAVVIDNAVKIDFTTSSELAIKHFEIERSADGTNFNQISIVAPKGESAYTVYDYKVQPGLSYYRIKEVSKDGLYTYSKVVSINKNDENEVSIYPTLITNHQIRFSGLVNQEAVLSLLSLSGNKVFSHTISGQVMDLPELTSGIYIATIKKGNKILAVQRVMIK